MRSVVKKSDVYIFLSTAYHQSAAWMVVRSLVKKSDVFLFLSKARRGW